MQPEERVMTALDELIDRTEELLSHLRDGALPSLQECLEQRETQVCELTQLVKAIDVDALRQKERFVVTWARLQQLGQEVTLAMTARHASARIAFSELNKRKTVTNAYSRASSPRRPVGASGLSVER